MGKTFRKNKEETQKWNKDRWAAERAKRQKRHVQDETEVKDKKKFDREDYGD